MGVRIASRCDKAVLQASGARPFRTTARSCAAAERPALRLALTQAKVCERAEGDTTKRSRAPGRLEGSSYDLEVLPEARRSDATRCVSAKTNAARRWPRTSLGNLTPDLTPTA